MIAPRVGQELGLGKRKVFVPVVLVSFQHGRLNLDALVALVCVDQARIQVGDACVLLDVASKGEGLAVEIVSLQGSHSSVV